VAPGRARTQRPQNFLLSYSGCLASFPQEHLYGVCPSGPRDPARAPPDELHSAFDSCILELRMRGRGKCRSVKGEGGREGGRESEKEEAELSL